MNFMNRYNNRIWLSVVLYLMITTVLYIQRPSSMFDEHRMREFGVEKEKTLTPFPLVIFLIATLIYYSLGMICVLKNCGRN